MNKVMLDMDGVLVNFHGKSLEIHGKSSDTKQLREHGPWMPSFLGLTEDEFWAKMPSTFWEDLPPMDDFEEIITIAIDAVGVENVAICTAPSKKLNCIEGKTKWIEKHCPQLQENIIFVGNKYLTAHPDVVLVDDWSKQTNKFKEHNGKFVLLPRDWNERHPEADRTIDILRTELNDNINETVLAECKMCLENLYTNDIICRCEDCENKFCEACIDYHKKLHK